MYCFNFPEIFPGKPQDDKFLHDKVLQELGEFLSETDPRKQAVEAMDVLHSAETLVRKFFSRHPDLWPHEAIKEVVAKNASRGYYKGVEA